MPNDKLRVMGMIFHAYHGLYDGERENGQRFEVDVEMIYNAGKAATTDRIRDTIDVRKVYDHVKQAVTDHKFYLIEAMSQHIADVLLQGFPISAVTVRVRKPFAPLGGLANGTEIEIYRKKSA